MNTESQTTTTPMPGFDDALANQLVTGVGRWRRRRQIRNGVAAAAMSVVAVVGGMNVLGGSEQTVPVTVASEDGASIPSVDNDIAAETKTVDASFAAECDAAGEAAGVPVRASRVNTKQVCYSVEAVDHGVLVQSVRTEPMVGREGSVSITITFTEAGAERFSTVARECFSAEPTCPAELSVLAADGTAISVNGFNAPVFDSPVISLSKGTTGFTAAEAAPITAADPAGFTFHPVLVVASDPVPTPTPAPDPFAVPASANQILAKLAEKGDVTWFVSDSTDCSSSVDENRADDPIPIGPLAGLYVLQDIVDAVAAGSLDWDEQITIRQDLMSGSGIDSPVSGSFEQEADVPGDQHSLQTFAQAMIRRQHQTAMNHLVDRLDAAGALSPSVADLAKTAFVRDVRADAEASLQDLCELTAELRQDATAGLVMNDANSSDNDVVWQSFSSGGGLGFFTATSLNEAADGSSLFRAISISFDAADTDVDDLMRRVDLANDFVGWPR